MDYKTAVLEGCKLFPMQAFNLWFGQDSSSACVNGTALGGLLQDAFIVWLRGHYSLTLIDAFPILSTRTICPSLLADYGCSLERSVLDMTIHLNDRHRWTREKIADWVDEL